MSTNEVAQIEGGKKRAKFSGLTKAEKAVLRSHGITEEGPYRGEHGVVRDANLAKIEAADAKSFAQRERYAQTEKSLKEVKSREGQVAKETAGRTHNEAMATEEKARVAIKRARSHKFGSPEKKKRVVSHAAVKVERSAVATEKSAIADLTHVRIGHSKEEVAERRRLRALHKPVKRSYTKRSKEQIAKNKVLKELKKRSRELKKRSRETKKSPKRASPSAVSAVTSTIAAIPAAAVGAVTGVVNAAANVVGLGTSPRASPKRVTRIVRSKEEARRIFAERERRRMAGGESLSHA
jgi:hypothetical protein